MAEDHTPERVTDWRQVAPRWLLLGLLFGSWTVAGFFGWATVNLLKTRIEEMEQRASDPWKAEMAKLTERMGTSEMRIGQHEALIQALDVRTQITDVQGEVKVINAKLGLLNERLSTRGF